MITIWKQYQDDMPGYALFIEAGLSKLENYYNMAIQVPAYQLAICIKSYFLNLKCKVTKKLYYIFSTSSFKKALLVYTKYA